MGLELATPNLPKVTMGLQLALLVVLATRARYFACPDHLRKHCRTAKTLGRERRKALIGHRVTVKGLTIPTTKQKSFQAVFYLK